MKLGITERHVVMYSRQRAATEQLARCRQCTPFPQREELQLGKGLTGYPRWCAGRGTSSPAACLTAFVSHLDCLPTLFGRRGEPGHKAEVPEGHTVGSQDLTGASRMANNNASTTGPARPTTSPKGDYFSSLMMAISPPALMTTGSFVFNGAALHGTLADLGLNRSTVLAIPQDLLTCSPIPTSGPTSPPTPTGIGMLDTSSC